MVLRDSWVDSSVIFTVAPGTVAPVASITVPDIWPALDWANVLSVVAATRKKIATIGITNKLNLDETRTKSFDCNFITILQSIL